MESQCVRQDMTEFWNLNSKEGSIEEMMLDNTAKAMSQEELPEILSYLPDITGKTVLELGSGIGRFTTHLAQKAEKVFANDFMPDFIEQNKATNQHFGNVEFEVADVTKIERQKESVDFIFSNWLMMYLDDEETLALFKKELSWLRPGGYLFLRESCFYRSGNKDVYVQVDPSKYRSPDAYETMYQSVTIPCDENKSVYGFEIICSKSVDTYVKMKKNKDQIFWLLQKTRVDQPENQGYRTFQKFLDTQQYSSKQILLSEKVSGPTFVCPGGIETTKEFVSKLNLKPGQRVLDLGGGIGGSAFYMAKNFNVTVVSMDLSSNMTEIGKKRAEESGCGHDKVVFETADATKREYQAGSYDVIYSRDVIFHIEDKHSLFRKFYKWLKPGGKLLITDSCCSQGEHSQQFKEYAKQRGFHHLSHDAYSKVLENAGFTNIEAEDRTSHFAGILHAEAKRIETMKEEITTEFDESSYQYIVDGWKDKIARAETGEYRWGLFYAEKALQ